MANIKEVANRIHSVKSTQQITQAMKMVAAAKLHKVQQQLLQVRSYVDELAKILTRVIAYTNLEAAHPYLEERPVENLLIVVIASDRGLCGSFNTHVFRKVLNYIQESAHQLTPAQVTILPIGKKALTFFQKTPFTLLPDYTVLSQHIDSEHTDPVANWLVHTFFHHTYDQILLVYNEFQSTATHTPVVKQWLPSTRLTTELSQQEKQLAYIYEPSPMALIKTLFPHTLQSQFYKALFESSASEHGARMTTMSKAADNAEELLKTLRLTYNRTRQALITREISEIVAAADALAP